MSPHTYLEPDETSLYHATYVLLLPCPFCGAEAGPPFEKVNETPAFSDRPIYQSVIGCKNDTRCGASVLCNDYTRDAARNGAIAKWQDRRPARNRLTAEQLATSPARRW